MILDITQPLNAGVLVWPGDTKFAFDLTRKRGQGGSVNVGRIVMGTHTGTHVDVPFHFRDDSARVGALDLEAFAGPTRIIEFRGKSIGTKELERYGLQGVERLLVRTGSWPDRTIFPAGITHLRPDAAPFLRRRKSGLSGWILTPWTRSTARSCPHTKPSSRTAFTSSKVWFWTTPGRGTTN